MSRVVLWPRHEVLQLVLPIFGNCGRLLTNKVVIEASGRLLKNESGDGMTSFDQWLQTAKDSLKWNEQTGQLFWDILMAAVWYKTEKSLIASTHETKTDYIILFLSLHTTETPSKSPILSQYDSVWPGQMVESNSPAAGMGSPASKANSSANSGSLPVPSSPMSSGSSMNIVPPLSPTHSPPTSSAIAGFSPGTSPGGSTSSGSGTGAVSMLPALPSSPRSPTHASHGGHGHGGGVGVHSSSPGKPGGPGTGGPGNKGGLSAYTRPTAAQHLNTIRVRLPLILRAMALRYQHSQALPVPSLAAEMSASGDSSNHNGSSAASDDSSTGTGNGNVGLSISSSVFAQDSVVAKHDVDCLGLLMGGGRHRDDEVSYISSLNPHLAGMNHGSTPSSANNSVHGGAGNMSPSPPTTFSSQSTATIPSNELLSWLEANLCVNESLYPSNASTSTVSKASLAAATSMLDTGKDGSGGGAEAAVGGATTLLSGGAGTGTGTGGVGAGAGGLAAANAPGSGTGIGAGPMGSPMSGSGGGGSSASISSGGATPSSSHTNVLISSKVITHSGPIRIIYPITYLSAARPTVISGASSLIMHVMATPTNCGRYRSRSISAGMYGGAGVGGNVLNSALHAASAFNSTAFQESLTAAVRSTSDLSLEDAALKMADSKESGHDAAAAAAAAAGISNAPLGRTGSGGAGNAWAPSNAPAFGVTTPSFMGSGEYGGNTGANNVPGMNNGQGQTNINHSNITNTPFNRSFSDGDGSKADDFITRAVNNTTKLSTEALPHMVLQNSSRTSIYVLSPYATGSIIHCSDCDIIAGPVAGVLIITDCERVRISAIARKIILRNCHDCVVSCGTLSPVIVAGDSRGLSLGPYNTCYKDLIAHMELAGLSALLQPKYRKHYSRGLGFDATSTTSSSAGYATAGSTFTGSSSGTAVGTGSESAVMDELDSMSMVREQRSTSGGDQQQPSTKSHSIKSQQQQHNAPLGGSSSGNVSGDMWWCLWDVSQCVANPSGSGSTGTAASTLAAYASAVTDGGSVPPSPYSMVTGQMVGMPAPTETIASLQSPEKYRFITIPEQSQCQSMESCPVEIPKAYARSFNSNKASIAALAGKIMGEMSVPPPPPPAPGSPNSSSASSASGTGSPQSSARSTGRAAGAMDNGNDSHSSSGTNGSGSSGARRDGQHGRDGDGDGGAESESSNMNISSTLGHMMLSGKFMEWLLTTGKASQIIELIRLDHQLQLQQQQSPSSISVSHSNSANASHMNSAATLMDSADSKSTGGNTSSRDGKGSAGVNSSSDHKLMREGKETKK